MCSTHLLPDQSVHTTVLVRDTHISPFYQLLQGSGHAAPHKEDEEDFVNERASIKVEYGQEIPEDGLSQNELACRYVVIVGVTGVSLVAVFF